MNPPIAIIGAGPCGLTLARLLECKKIDYVVYERDETATSANAGGTLDLHHGTGQRAMREAGLWDAFCKEARWEDDRFVVYDKQGTRLHEQVGGGHGDETGRPEIDRRALRQILLDSVPKEKIRWSSPLKAVKMDQTGSPILEFVNGTTTGGFKLVVGADGAWSKVRSLITEAKPSYSGRTYVETQFPLDNPLYKTMANKIGFGSAAILAGLPQIMVQRQGNASYRVYFGIRAPEEYVRENIDPANIAATRDALLTDFYADWADELKDYVRSADNFRSWPLCHLPAESQNWTTVPGLAVAGDAAHLALPNGEGVNLAMKDALELASKVEAFGLGNLEEAVREYEKELFVRGREHIADGIWMEKMLANEKGPSEVVRFFLENEHASS
ncbi:Fc.00g095720.m01.CDS01 [Cosmosporella sp. VM-42]